ncbi:MAG: helix-turn-helix domain-containing protein [Acidimicrobiia bacterium]
MDDNMRLRRRAVELAGQGWRPAAIGRELGRSREWVRVWLGRYEAEGEAALVDRSRRPHSSPTRLPESVINEIVTVRGLLEGDRFANSGPAAIAAEIERRGLLGTVPSLSSIKRVVAQAGLSRPYRKRRRSNTSFLGLPNVTEPGVWQQSDWVQDRHLAGGIRFQSLQITDVGSHMMSAAQHPRRTLNAAVRQLTERAWPHMSIPLAMGTDNAFVGTSHRNNPWTIWIRVLLMFGVEAIIAPPNSLGFTNHVEAVNWLWQDRTINRYHYDSLEALRVDTVGFLDWANTRRAILNPEEYGTRYPVEYVAAHTDQLRWPPPGFRIDDYLQPGNTNRIPLTRGRVTFLRHIDTGHTITIANTTWPVPKSLPLGVLVVAAINTATGRLKIRHRGDLVATHNYPMEPAGIDPYHPIADQGLLDHLPTMS